MTKPTARRELHESLKNLTYSPLIAHGLLLKVKYHGDKYFLIRRSKEYDNYIVDVYSAKSHPQKHWTLGELEHLYIAGGSLKEVEKFVRCYLYKWKM